MISIEDIQAAHNRIKPYINHTPVLTSGQIDAITGASLFFKCENFQKVGAFKARGGSNAILSLSDEELSKGICTHSSGNHAQAVAYAAKLRGAKAYIVMPSNAPKVKKEAVLEYNAQIIECEPIMQAREDGVNKLIEEKGCTFIHPYNNWKIIEGQATASKELYEEVDELDFLLTPIGGGGLISGTLLTTKHLSPTTKVIGCEPIGADAAYQSLKNEEHTLLDHPQSICDGLLASLGEINYSIIKEHVHDILTVTDDQVLEAMKLTWERMKILIEPSSAVCLAVVLKNKPLFSGKRIGVIISGGNVDVKEISQRI